MRSLFPVLFALLLGLSLAGQGAVPLAAATGPVIVLCSPGGNVTVTLGPDGTPRPAADHTHCPACLPVPAIDPAAGPPPAAPQRTARRVALPPAASPHRPRVIPHPPARAPPRPPVV
jgi:hypothetical protein